MGATATTLAINVGSTPTSDIPGLRASNFTMTSESPAGLAWKESCRPLVGDRRGRSYSFVRLLLPSVPRTHHRFRIGLGNKNLANSNRLEQSCQRKCSDRSRPDARELSCSSTVTLSVAQDRSAQIIDILWEKDFRKAVLTVILRVTTFGHKILLSYRREHET